MIHIPIESAARDIQEAAGEHGATAFRPLGDGGVILFRRRWAVAVASTHRPDYEEPFWEEAARMTGDELAAARELREQWERAESAARAVGTELRRIDARNETATYWSAMQHLLFVAEQLASYVGELAAAVRRDAIAADLRDKRLAEECSESQDRVLSLALRLTEKGRND